MTDFRYITLVSAQPALTVTGMRGQNAPVPVTGFGGWNVIQRPRKESITEWDGVDPIQDDIQIVLGLTPNRDSLAQNISCQPDLNRLMQMGRPPSAGSEPPKIRVIGVVPHPGITWVIQGFDWDASPVYSAEGFLVRQMVTVHLLKYVSDTLIASKSAAGQARDAALTAAANKARAAGGNSTTPTGAGITLNKLYTVRAADIKGGLAGIAARLLGSYKRASEIAALNGITDPKRIHVGEQLRLP